MAQEKFAVIGAGHFGQAISHALSEKGFEVLVVDSNISVVQDISEEVAYAVCADATSKRALQNENIQDFDAVIVSIGNDFVGRLLCTANLLDLGVKRIICRVMGKSQRTILEKMGITEFLSPEDEVPSSPSASPTPTSSPTCNSPTTTRLPRSSPPAALSASRSATSTSATTIS